MVTRALLLCALVAAGVGCKDRTYLIVTVEVAPEVAGSINQLRFVQRLVRDGAVIDEIERRFPERPSSKPIDFPNSYVITADGFGDGGEQLEVVVEAMGSGGAMIARGRGSAPVIENQESTASVTLRNPCGSLDDCLGQTAFCDAPQTCECESDESCAEGFCQPVAIEDGNDCTLFSCNETGRVVSHMPVEDGAACGGAMGLDEAQVCVAGICGCGDAITNGEVEECDEGDNANAPNRCRIDPPCSLPRCGDGIIDDEPPFNEECDDGPANSFAPDACRPTCRLPACGDQIVDSGEQCDEGLRNSDTAALACRTVCALPSCGDGVIDVGPAFGESFDEECDDGDENSDTAADACRAEIVLEEGAGATVSCRLAFCGDGVVDSGERCDDNNSANGDGCNPTCVLRGDVALIAGGRGGPGTADGTGDAARVRDPFDFAVIGDRAFFTADENHDTSIDHSVRALDVVTGAVTRVAGSPFETGDEDGLGAAARFSAPRGLDTDGTVLYLADSLNHRLRRIDPSTGEVTTVVGTGVPGSTNGALATARLAQPQLVAVVSATQVLVMDTLLTEGCDLRSVDLAAETVSLLAGDGACDFPADGVGAGAAFVDPTAMAMGPDGFAYVAERTFVRRVDPATGEVVTVAGSFSEGFADGTGFDVEFASIGGLATGDDEVWVADTGNHVIRRIDVSDCSAGCAVTTVFGAAQSPGTGDGVGGRFTGPRGLGANGSLLVLGEAAQHTLRTVEVRSGAIDTVAGLSAQPGEADGDGAAARFARPRGLAVSGDELFLADENNRTLRAIDLGAPTHAVRTLGSSPALRAFSLAFDATGRLFGVYQDQQVFEHSPSSGSPTGLTPGAPIDLAALGQGNGIAVLGDFAYVADVTDAVIRRIDLTDGSVDIFAGTERTRGVADGPVESALFGAPAAIAVCAGDLYVAESARTFAAHVIRKIEMDGAPVVSTIAGAAGLAGHADGTGTAARFSRPEALACDGQSLYVAELGTHLIRQLELGTNRVTTLAGVAGEAGAIDGTGTDARFSLPLGLAFDPASGDLFVTDASENVVRRIQ